MDFPEMTSEQLSALIANVTADSLAGFCGLLPGEPEPEEYRSFMLSRQVRILPSLSFLALN